MAPLTVQPVSGGQVFDLDPLEVGTDVSDLKEAIGRQTGVAACRQRVVARGRILDNGETLSTLGLASGGRVFLALLPDHLATEDVVPRAAAELEPCVADDDTVTATPSTTGSAPAAASGFEVIARAVDAECEVTVFTLSSSSIAAFKREALSRLGHLVDAEDEVRGYSFVCDGKLLQDDTATVADCGIGPETRVIVVPPHVRAAMRPAPRLSCRQLPGVCLRRSRQIGGFVVAFPSAFLAWFAATWEDPWSLVRPNVSVEDRPGGRRHHMFRVHHRAVRYGPGQNPHGEDLTVLLTQGLLGGAG